MTRGTRMLIMMMLLIGVILLMMDCAKKTMRKQHHPEGAESGAGQSLLIPESPPVRA